MTQKIQRSALTPPLYHFITTFFFMVALLSFPSHRLQASNSLCAFPYPFFHSRTLPLCLVFPSGFDNDKVINSQSGNAMRWSCVCTEAAQSWQKGCTWVLGLGSADWEEPLKEEAAHSAPGEVWKVFKCLSSKDALQLFWYRNGVNTPSFWKRYNSFAEICRRLSKNQQ